MFLLYNQAFWYRTNWFSILCSFLYVVTVITVVTTQQVAAANQVASNTPPTDRDSVRRTNRNNALKAITVSGDSLVLWGSEDTLSFTGVPDTKVQYTAKLNEHILQKIASKAAVPKEILVKDEFETTQAFESRKKDYDNQYNAQVKVQASQAEQERPRIYADGFNAVLGTPVLNKVEYDADKETFNLSISALWADYVINVKVKVPPANAKETKANIESMNPWVVFQIEGEKVIPKSIILQNKPGTASSIKRLDFTDRQENQALSIGINAYTAIMPAKKQDDDRIALVKKQAEDRYVQEKQAEAAHKKAAMEAEAIKNRQMYTAIDEAGLEILLSDWRQVCDQVKDITVLDRVIGTASANNHPAYVIGYSFICASVDGNQRFIQYIGWMDNRDSNRHECLHHHQDKSNVLNNGWWGCGGNFRVTGGG